MLSRTQTLPVFLGNIVEAGPVTTPPTLNLDTGWGHVLVTAQLVCLIRCIQTSSV